MAHERPRFSIMVDAAEAQRFNADRAANNDLKQSAMIRAYQRGWQMLTMEQQHAALRGEYIVPNAAGEYVGTIHEACNKVQRIGLEIREAVDSYYADGKLDKSERNAIRRLTNMAGRAVCSVAVHANEPMAQAS